ncbi:MAG: substrate-binding domain-containing protein [Chloroflexota bacterium]
MNVGRNRIGILFLTVLTAVMLAACGGGSVVRSGDTMTVLAGSEVKDLEPLLDQIRRETDVSLEFDYIGTLNGAEELLEGADYDLAWFSHGNYLTLLQGGRGLIQTQEKIMLSPVIMGVKESVAREFGWIDNPDVTWQDIADKAASGELRYAMTNPTASNSASRRWLAWPRPFPAAAMRSTGGMLISKGWRRFSPVRR